MAHPSAKLETVRALTVDCPSCGMGAGAACTSGRRRTSPHAARHEAYLRRRQDSASAPAFTRHLMTLEAAPADELDPDCTEMAFASRCICGENIPWGPYAKTTAAVRDHLARVGLLAGEDGSDDARP
jgi:hypothetical protein